MKFDRRAHAVFILDEMEEMMREKSLCDFTIKVSSEEIKTHRVVLAASSKYFRSILTSDTQQSQSGYIDMFNIDLESAKICIDFIYNRKVMIPVEKYENLKYVANMMQLKELCDYIYTQLGENLERNTNASSTVQQDADSRKPQTSGLQVAQNDGSTRRRNVNSSGLKTVSSPASARQLWAASRESSIVLFDEASEHLLRFNPRGHTVTQMKEMFDEMKAIHYSAVEVDDYVCVMKEQKFHRFKYSDATSPWEQMPDMICDHGLRAPVTATMGCMYVCGGSVLTATAAFEKFDLGERKWEKLKDKPQASMNSAILASNGNVYSIGGRVEGGATNRVERFNIASSTWAEVAPMKYARLGAAAVKANRSIFVLGGWVAGLFGKALDEVERYCVLSNQWTEIKPMKIARYEFKAFAIDGTIYAVGGRNSDAAWGSIDKYQVARDEWEVVELSSAGRKLEIYDSVEIKI